MHFDWPYYWSQLFLPSDAFITGLWLTVAMAISGQVIGMILGLGIAQARMSKHCLPRYLASTYIWAIRGAPLLVQIVLIYTGLAAANIIRFEDITVGGFTFAGNVQAAILALGLNEAAYTAEVFHAGIGVSEMLLVTETINSATFRTFELYAVLGIYFLILTSIWTLFMGWAERRLTIGRQVTAIRRPAEPLVEGLSS
jgi:polar amino acid transport system permease protein